MKVIPGGLGFVGEEAAWVTPIDEIPTFRVQTKRLPPQRAARIADLNKVNAKDPEFVGLYKAQLDSAKASILSWEGEEDVFGRPVPYSLDNVEIVAFARLVVKEGSDGVLPVYETVWFRVQRKLDESQEIETKN